MSNREKEDWGWIVFISKHESFLMVQSIMLTITVSNWNTPQNLFWAFRVKKILSKMTYYGRKSRVYVCKGLKSLELLCCQ